MAITIDATVGGASANSFVTLVEFTAYMDGRLNYSSFTSAADDTKNRALAEATRELSARGWTGYRVTSTQALAWPRQWAPDPDSPTQTYYDTDVVPQRVKDATMELAWQFIKAGTVDVAALDSAAGVKRKKVDVIETEYDSYRRPTGLARYPSVTRYVRPLLSGSSSMIARTVRG